jgi:hypothetical protein
MRNRQSTAGCGALEGEPAMSLDQQHQNVRQPWNAGRVIGAKPPLKPRHIWSIRTRLQLERRVRDLAIFNLAIDSKLRGCDLVKLRVSEALRYTQHLDDPDFKTGTPEADRAFLRDLVAFYVVFEGMWFYTGFAQILSLGRRNKMICIAEQW